MKTNLLKVNLQLFAEGDNELQQLLGDELYKQVIEKVGDKQIAIGEKNFVPLSRVEAAKAEVRKELEPKIEALNDELKTRDKQLSDLKKDAKDVEGLEEKIKGFEEANKQTAKTHEEQMAAMLKSHKVEMAIVKDQGKDAAIILGMLDLDKISVDGENLVGYQEQIDARKKSHPYLFGEKKVVQPNNPHQDPNGVTEPSGRDFKKELAEARKSGNTRDAIRIKDEALKEGISLY